MAISWLGRFVGWNNKVAKPAARPMGVGGESGPSGSVSQKITPLSEPKSLGALVKEMECDYQVMFSKYILTANISAVKVSVSVDGPIDPKAQGIAKKLEELWQKSVGSMVEACGYGRQAFEKTNAYDPTVPCTYVKRLEPIDFADSRLKLTDDNKYDGFEVRINGPDEAEKWIPVAPENSWWLAIDATPRNPHGRSQYRGALEAAWKQKRENVRNLNMFVKRFAIRGGIAHGPMTEMDELTGQIYSCPEKFHEAVEQLYTGGTLFLPNDPHEDADMAKAGKYKWDFDEAKTEMLDPAPIMSVLDRDDVNILRARGIPEKAAIEGDGGGSYAMLTQQMLTLFAVVDSVVAQFVASFQEFVADPMGCLNYGEGGPKFKVTAVKLTNRPDSFVVQMLTQMATQPQFGSLVMSGAVNLRSLLESVGLPVTPELEDVAKQVAQMFMATSAALKAGPGGVPGTSPAADDPNAPSGGEFQNLGRRQLMNNFKAVDDVLEAVAAGSMTSTIAQSKLETLGVNSDRAAKMIADASDGTVDGPVTMANMLRRQQGMFRKFLNRVKKK